MGSFSTIEWTEVTWNPVTGCYKVSQGCKHCYKGVLTEDEFQAQKAFVLKRAAA